MHHNTIVELELDAVPHSFESRVIVKDVDSIYFLFPVDPAEGPEGIYVKLIESLGMGI
ncbi:hypothetical protein TAM4_931 [Thermococcus sp. AM4]|nr:hypothetical protein TAM4_931 [Thermococcus sp. AM4]